MNQMKRILALVLAMALGVTLLAGCSKGDSSSAASSSEPSSSEEYVEIPLGSTVEPMDLTGVTDPYLATLGLAGDTVVGTVGGMEITAAELGYWLNANIKLILQQYAMIGIEEIDWEADAQGQTVEEGILENALQLAAYYRLLPEQGAKDGLTVPQEQVDSLAGDQQSIVDQLGSEEAATYYYWLSMMTPELFQELFLAGEMSLLLQDHYFGEGAQGYPTDAEVSAYATDEQGYYRAKHILLLTKDMEQTVTNEDGTTGYAPLDDATVAEKKALADDLMEQLRAAQDPVALFDTLMHEHSEDSGLEANPDGYTTTKGVMVPEFEETALALKDGEISEVVESDYGYHIILRLPFLSLDDFRTSLVAKKMEEKNYQWLEEYGVETAEAFEQVDPSDFWDKALSLQMSAYLVVEEALAAAKGEAAADGSAAPQG